VRHRPRHFALVLALIGVPFAAVTAADGDTSVTVQVTGLRSTKGVVRACMTPHANRFPRCQGNADAYSVVVPASATVTLEFPHVKPGRYAIALLHDENGNGKADRALSMIPREGFGFSRDAPVRMGPPSFDSAAITIAAAPVRQAIRMRYML
jgi:uncharacterized protein (DUF2141 family)